MRKDVNLCSTVEKKEKKKTVEAERAVSKTMYKAVLLHNATGLSIFLCDFLKNSFFLSVIKSYHNWMVWTQWT